MTKDAEESSHGQDGKVAGHPHKSQNHTLTDDSLTNQERDGLIGICVRAFDDIDLWSRH